MSVKYLATPVKSKSDKKEYRAIELPNKMVVLVVSDPETEKSAASLSVKVGCLEDPVDRLGMAHFLEHMIFFGNEKYPEEKEYFNYIMKNAGTLNAFTQLTATTYMFEIANNFFEGGLDRFSNNFVGPLFKDTHADQEMKAVDSEYQKNIMSDLWRNYDMFRFSSKKSHPYSKFGIGNLQTLKHENIRNDLVKFYQKYYSANQMKAVIYGRESLDVLEKKAIEYFALIKNWEAPKLVYSEHPFEFPQYSEFWKVTPINEKDELSFTWLLDNFLPDYKSNPAEYYSQLLGYEGKGSLRSLLFDEGLATGVHTGYYNELELFTVFTVTIVLTQKGLSNYSDVAGFVFKYIKMLKEKGPSETFFKDIQRKKQLEFEFLAKQKPYNFVMFAAGDMFKYPIEDILSYKYLFEEFQKDKLQKTIESFKLENLRITLRSKTLQNECDLTLDYYGAKYTKGPIPENIAKLYENPTTEPKVSKKTLDLPGKNPFLPDDLSVHTKNPQQLPDFPSKIYESPFIEFYFKQDNQFLFPKADLRLKLYTNSCNFGKTAKAALLGQLWTNLFNESLNELTYDASMGGLHVSISLEDDGLLFHLSGYNDPLGTLLNMTLKQIREFKVETYEQHFENIYTELMRSYKNNLKETPYLQGAKLATTILLKGGLRYHPEEMIQTLKEITFKHLVEFQEEWLTTIRADSLLVGNFTQEKAIDLICQAEKEIKTLKNSVKVLTKDLVPEVRVAKLPIGKTIIFENELKPDESGQAETNSFILSLFQYDFEDLETSMMLNILNCYVADQFFNQLRTTEQLGYVAMTQNRPLRLIGHIAAFVQSSVKTTDYISGRITAFFDKIRVAIQNMSDKEYELYRSTTRERFRDKDTTLGEQAARFWLYIDNHTFFFNKKETFVKEMLKIPKEKFQQLYEDLFYNKRKLLEVHLISPHHKQENQELREKRLKADNSTIVVKEVETFHRQLSLYPDYHNAYIPLSKIYDTTNQYRLKVAKVLKAAPFFEAEAFLKDSFIRVNIDEYLGKYVVLFFYPRDFSRVCPTEIIAFSESYDSFKALNCEVLGVSTDSKFCHREYSKKPTSNGGVGELKYPLVADAMGKIATSYGVYDAEEGKADRATFIIDRKGVIRHFSVNDSKVARNIEEVLRLVEAFQYSDEHGEVCPMNWKKGKKTLKPSHDAPENAEFWKELSKGSN